MDREGLILQLEQYTPFNEQQAMDRELILNWIRSCPDAYQRSNTAAHITASAWVVNPDRTRVLMAYHHIYDSWAWLGGHADGDEDLPSVALREVEQESGLSGVRLLLPGIFSLEALTVDGHEKRGRYVSSHLHLNITFLVQADDSLPLAHKPDENAAVAWFAPEEALKASTEPWFVQRIYGKLIAKLDRLKEETPCM